MSNIEKILAKLSVEEQQLLRQHFAQDAEPNDPAILYISARTNNSRRNATTDVATTTEPPETTDATTTTDPPETADKSTSANLRNRSVF